MTIHYLIYLLNMVICHSYVGLSEGSGTRICWWNDLGSTCCFQAWAESSYVGNHQRPSDPPWSFSIRLLSWSYFIDGLRIQNFTAKWLWLLGCSVRCVVSWCKLIDVSCRFWPILSLEVLKSWRHPNQTSSNHFFAISFRILAGEILHSRGQTIEYSNLIKMLWKVNFTYIYRFFRYFSIFQNTLQYFTITGATSDD